MKRTLIAGLLPVAGIVFAAAQGQWGEIDTKMQAQNLVVDFVSTNLTPGEMVKFGIAGEATAVYGCIGKGERNAITATHLRTINKKMWMEGTFMVRGEGWVREILSLNPPPATNLSCSDPSQRVALASVKYENVRLFNVSKNKSMKLKGAFSNTFHQVR